MNPILLYYLDMKKQKEITWKFEEKLPSKLAEAATDAFDPFWASPHSNMDEKYNWRDYKCEWWDGTKIGEVTFQDRWGEIVTMKAYLMQSPGIMRSVHGYEKWRLRLEKK